MTKTIISYIFLAFMFYSCSSSGQVQTPDSPGSTDDSSAAEEAVAPWYDHSGKAYSDSSQFGGMGMAIATDSSEAKDAAMSQARENLEFAIDSYAENLRRELAEETNNGNLTTGSFVLSLRRAVNALQIADSDATSITEYSARENGAVVAYSRINVPKELAIDKLATSIENRSFSQSLRESTAMQP